MSTQLVTVWQRTTMWRTFAYAGFTEETREIEVPLEEATWEDGTPKSRVDWTGSDPDCPYLVVLTTHGPDRDAVNRVQEAGIPYVQNWLAAMAPG